MSSVRAQFMNDELEITENETVVAYWRYYPDICLETLRKTIKNLTQDSLCPVQDSNRNLPLEPTSSVL
jgi:hypothetical protein